MTKIRLLLFLLSALLSAILLFEAPPSPAGAYTTFMTLKSTPFRWNLDGNRAIRWNVAPGAPDIVRACVRDSLQAWSDATDGRLQFEEAPGGISIVWDTAGTKLFDPVFLAYTSFTGGSDDSILNAQVVINAAQYTWHRGGYGGVGPTGVDGRRDASLDSVLLHELGHALGLNHSDRNPSAIVGAYSISDLPTMNAQIIPGAETLHSDDIAGMRTLYGAGEGQKSLPPPPLVIRASKIIGRKPLRVVFTQSGGDQSTEWDFGDGTRAIGAETTHRFKSWGEFTVKAQCNGRSGEVAISVSKIPKRK